MLEADLHVHTVASGHAFSTIKENAEAAAAKGLKLIAICDHGLNMPGGPNEYYFRNLSNVPRVLEGVEVLHGVEANIIGVDGRLDMPEYLLAGFDIVLAGFHKNTGFDGYSQEQYTQAAVAALSNPYVHMLTHPGNPMFPINIPQVVMAARAHRKVLEINNNSFASHRPGSIDRCQVVANLARQHYVMVALNSDAHIYTAVGGVTKALELATSSGIKEDQILNLTAARVKEYLSYHRRKRKALA